jgi:hypothetical protein
MIFLNKILKVQVKKHKKKRINKKYISRYGYRFIDNLGDKIMHDTINNVMYCSSVIYSLIKQELIKQEIIKGKYKNINYYTNNL